MTTSCSQDQETYGVREEDDECVSNQSEDHRLRVTEKALHCAKRGIVGQHDPRDVDVLVKDFGLEHGNSVPTPGTLAVTAEEESEPLSQDQHRRYRSQVARCLFFSRDRADRTFIVNELCHKMSSPNQQSIAKKACQEFETRAAVGTSV